MKVPEILKSKKAHALILGILAVILSKIVGLSDEEVNKIVALVGTYILGQGISDNGKEAAKINVAPTPPAP